MKGVRVPSNIYAHIAGVDIVKTSEDQFYVLEDNLRTPSGVSYVLENRKMMYRLFPELFSSMPVAPVDHFGDVLLENLRTLAPENATQPITVVVMTPGSYNSAYFEHVFLAQQMGVETVEGQDMFVTNDIVYLRTTDGPQRVDVIYRRIDDEYLDPLTFRADSTLGVPGLFDAYRAGNVTLANAIGAGVADDKTTYLYVPQMIEFYLNEKPIIPNVPTYKLSEPDDYGYVMAHLAELVVKEVHGSGGYGMLVGPTSTKVQIADFRKIIEKNPKNYIACPTFADSDVVPRHVDLRPYVLSGKTVSLIPGGLTRVALREGSLVVNSSQGGGTKDTWILEDQSC
jgi:uncharacterized circularly permuted ATP-grasp superfamily protein